MYITYLLLVFESVTAVYYVGISLYLAWACCATTLNTITMLHYQLGVSMTHACFGGLITLNVILVVWFVCELIFDRQLR